MDGGDHLFTDFSLGLCRFDLQLGAPLPWGREKSALLRANNNAEVMP